jgi:hypothetical protein
LSDLQRRLTSLTTELEVAQEEKANIVAKRTELERTVRVSDVGMMMMMMTTTTMIKIK